MGMTTVEEASANATAVKFAVEVYVGNIVGMAVKIREEASAVNAPPLLISEKAKSTMLTDAMETGVGKLGSPNATAETLQSSVKPSIPAAMTHRSPR